MSFNPIRDQANEVKKVTENPMLIAEGLEMARRMKMLTRQWEFFQRRLRRPSKALAS